MMDARALTEWEARKLDDIRSLPGHELRHWYAVITSGYMGYYRQPFPGEIAACADRARDLGISLSEPIE